MKKRILIGALIVIVGIGLVFAMSGCEAILGALSGESQPYGQVINAKAGTGIGNATITLEPIFKELPADADAEKEQEYQDEKAQIEKEQQDNPDAFTVTTDNNGEFDWWEAEKNVPRGTYRLTAAHSDYIFVPKTVELNAAFPDLGDVVGLPYNEDTDQYNISFVLMWNDTFADVDGHLTFPTAVNDPAGKPSAYDPYWVEDTGGATGFSPVVDSGGDDTSDPRERIYWDNATTAAGDDYTGSGIEYSDTYDFDFDLDGTYDNWMISLDVDDRDGSGPESITIRDLPWKDWTGVPTGAAINDYSGTSHDDLIDGDTYEWLGTLEYYARAYSYAPAADTTTEIIDQSYLSEVSDGYSADAVLYLFYGKTIVGIYTVPTYTEVKNASIVRVNAFVVESGGSEFAEFIIYPDIRIVDYTSSTDNDFRGLAPVNRVVNVRVPK